MELLVIIVKKQLEVLFRLGNVGRFVAMDLLEKMSTMGSILSSNISNITEDEMQRYRKFLVDELEKIDKSSKRKEIIID